MALHRNNQNRTRGRSMCPIRKTSTFLRLQTGTIYVTCDAWHLTCGAWHVGGMNILSKQVPSSHGFPLYKDTDLTRTTAHQIYCLAIEVWFGVNDYPYTSKSFVVSRKYPPENDDLCIPACPFTKVVKSCFYSVTTKRTTSVSCMSKCNLA